MAQLAARARRFRVKQSFHNLGLQNEIGQGLGGPIVHLLRETLAFGFLGFDGLNDGFVVRDGMARRTFALFRAESFRDARRQILQPPHLLNIVVELAVLALKLLQLRTHQEQFQLRVALAGVGLPHVFARVRIEIGFDLAQTRGHFILLLSLAFDFARRLANQHFDFARFDAQLFDFGQQFGRDSLRLRQRFVSHTFILWMERAVFIPCLANESNRAAARTLPLGCGRSRRVCARWRSCDF
ncbi:MAG: hypothetical protein HDKAJFGB_03347 [Anaerolineae bacterium]|nr:hypothetical protein [Anaerolineae bacterium]